MESLDHRSVVRPGAHRAGVAERLRAVPTLAAEAGDDTMATGAGLQVLGVSVRSAPLAIREPLVLDGEGVRSALLRARAGLAGGEALILSTCNRTELYVVGASDDAVAAWHRGVLSSASPDETCPALSAARYHLQGRAAACHLFRVAAGLESALLGDNEIVSQLRAAARMADDLGMLGPRLRLAVDHALRTSKQARSQTAIGAGGAGIGSAVAGLVARRQVPGCRVALIGAGDAASVIARELGKRLAVDLVVVNRSVDRAKALAVQHGGSAAALEALPDVLLTADAVVTATGSPTPILTPALVGVIRAKDHAWAPLVIDAGIPRNVDPACDLEVATMETLAERTQRMSRRRAAAVVEVERCIHEGLARWHVIEARRLSRGALGRLEALSAPVPAAS